MEIAFTIVLITLAISTIVLFLQNKKIESLKNKMSEYKVALLYYAHESNGYIAKITLGFKKSEDIKDCESLDDYIDD